MKNGICPKCGSKDIQARHNWLNLRPHRDFVVIFWGRTAKVIIYACMSCGYLENYVHEADLRTLAKKWPHVTQADEIKPAAAADLDG